MRVVWSPLALERVEAIARIIAADRPDAADRWVRSIFTRAAQLRMYAASGRMVPELRRSEIRQLPHPPYRIIYRIEAKRVLVLTVRHGREALDPGETSIADVG
jgi:toxin ParE1/3/4